MTHLKKGLILEGGGMRGLFSAGVTDALQRAGIDFDGVIGVSAGATFGCNFKSRQQGRALRYNIRFCGDKRYCSFSSLIKTGDLFNVDFCYRTIPYELDLFDTQAYNTNPLKFYIVCTDVQTGKAVYKCCDDADESIKWMQASASMPLAARIVDIDGGKYLDGGVADSIPVKYFQSIGYTKNLVVLTQPKNYVKGKNHLMPIMKLKYCKYPLLIKAIKERHLAYNQTLQYIEQQEKEGKLLVIRPPQKLPVGRTEKDPEKLNQAYNIGKNAAETMIDQIKAFLNSPQKV